ncbi:ABC transporter permease [Streptosporangium sp. NPDC048865]|uniref:ABC transporter permease n=1 Tax=Streptosporangium sp. NPDC048865 TaxID=3155766 RepID=UPI003443C296
MSTLTTTARPAPGAAPSRSRTAVFVNGFGNEVHKGLIGLRSEWRGTLIQIVMFGLFYLLVVMFMGRGELRADLLVTGLLGMVPLTFIHEQVNRSFWSYLGDIQSGTLEQTYLTSLPSWVVLLGRQVASVVGALPYALAVFVTGFVAIKLNDADMPFDVQALVPMASIVVGTCGLALILSGLTLVYKRVEVATQISIALWFVAGGTFVPLVNMPDWAAFLSRAFIPIAPGIEAMREILLKGRSLTGLQDGWGLTWVLLQPVLLLLAGIVLFIGLERVAKRRGTLGRY